jgi:hypothetical protein
MLDVTQDYTWRGFIRQRLRGFANRFNSLYDLKTYYSRKEADKFLVPGAGVVKELTITVPEYFKKTLFRDAELVAQNRIKTLARRCDCDVVVLENVRINRGNPENPDFNENASIRNYKAKVGFFKSFDYMNPHMSESERKLIIGILRKRLDELDR